MSQRIWLPNSIKISGSTMDMYGIQDVTPKRKFLWPWAFVLILLITGYYVLPPFQSYKPSPSSHHAGRKPPASVAGNGLHHHMMFNKQKTVLFWTKFFDADDFYVGFGNKPFEKCASSNCFSTNNRSLLNQSHAVVFHIRDLDLYDMPTHRLPHQRWIFFLLESPQYTPTFLAEISNVFNWTMTYRTESDIYMPYTAVETEKGIADNPLWSNVSALSWRRFARKKKRMAAWFVSNCFTISGREKYVAKLQQYIDVDVYGACGTLECPTEHRLQCYEMLEREYKFYLAFENSLCQDYVTEKFFNSLLFKTVPVVYGGANYSKVAPKGSYIDVRDFSSVRKLADYLKFLDKNSEEYLRYFDWHRKPPGLKKILPSPHRPWCSLCRMLHNQSLPAKTYKDINAWWYGGGECSNDHTIVDQLIA